MSEYVGIYIVACLAWVTRLEACYPSAERNISDTVTVMLVVYGIWIVPLYCILSV